jgi:hypothetical protein
LIAWAKRSGDPHWHSSHKGRLDFSITRGAWARTTIELPPGTRAAEIEEVAIECVDIRDPRNYGSSPRPTASLQQTVRGFLLNRDYVPVAVFDRNTNVQLASGQMTSIFSGH